MHIQFTQWNRAKLAGEAFPDWQKNITASNCKNIPNQISENILTLQGNYAVSQGGIISELEKKLYKFQQGNNLKNIDR